MQNHSTTMTTTTTTKRDLIVNVIDNESLRKGKKNKQMINDIDTVDDDHDIQGHHYIIINHRNRKNYK